MSQHPNFGSGSRKIIEELCRELGISMILFDAGGTAYWGILSRIEDGRFARLTPPPGKRGVVVIAPNGDFYREDFTIVDLCNIVGKAVNVIPDIFDGCKNFRKAALTLGITDQSPIENSVTMDEKLSIPTVQVIEDNDGEPRGRDDIIDQLCFFQGQNGFNARTWGGFQFTCSRLVDIEDCLIVLTDVKLRLPGDDEKIFLNTVTLVINAILSFGISSQEECDDDCHSCP
ncbi:hypothetical protein P22_3328 [Propionispora sp. 2/2-37]|uniref:hypothetical protein n=1 Tax=Propionispora sp. 2/2-37 TaxID=1677858 RepID=UPI0006BB8987|nr:hypothetical protein [Propionispora sp. 2/2-37]CUH97201.1 hypothetical protein P22_3328 [Propionispora sp. 2/2-37]